MSIRPQAVNLYLDALDAGFFTRRAVEDFHLVAVLLRPTEVHLHQHVSPVLALGAPRPGVDAEQGVSQVVGGGEGQLEFQLVQMGGERFHFGGDLVLQAGAGGGFVKRHQLGKLLGLALQRAPLAGGLLEVGELAHLRLGGARIGPEVGGDDGFF